MKPEEVFLTIEQAAAAGGVPVETLRTWIKLGRLDVTKNKGRVWIMKGSLETLLWAVCPVCGERFRRSTLRARFCSTLCRQRAHRARKGEA